MFTRGVPTLHYCFVTLIPKVDPKHNENKTNISFASFIVRAKADKGNRDIVDSRNAPGWVQRQKTKAPQQGLKSWFFADDCGTEPVGFLECCQGGLIKQGEHMNTYHQCLHCTPLPQCTWSYWPEQPLHQHIVSHACKDTVKGWHVGNHLEFSSGNCLQMHSHKK